MNEIVTFKDNLIANPEFIKYCNNEVCNPEQIKDDLYWAIKDVINKSKLSGAKITLKYNDTIRVNIELKSKLLSVDYTIGQRGIETEAVELSDMIRTIILGVDAVDRLNKLVFNRQQNGTDLFIKFKVGLDTYCKIGKEWTYDLVVIQLSDKAVKKLIELGDKLEKYLEPYIDDSLDTTICRLIRQFNSISLCSRLDLRLETPSVREEILREAICESDVKKLIENRRNKKSSECYQIEYYSIVEGLGTYLVKVMCDIDFGTKEVTTQVIDRIYDLDNDEFVTSVGLNEKIRLQKAKVGVEWTKYLKGRSVV